MTIETSIINIVVDEYLYSIGSGGHRDTSFYFPDDGQLHEDSDSMVRGGYV